MRWLVITQWLHVFLGVLWFGGTLYISLILIPALLPLPFLPFVPEQTLDRYLVHVWYALRQIPLIIVTAAALLARRV